jgi:hypothetical protein
MYARPDFLANLIGVWFTTRIRLTVCSDVRVPLLLGLAESLGTAVILGVVAMFHSSNLIVDIL